MDYYKRTSNLIKAYYNYVNNNDIAYLIKETCNYFDLIKDKKLTQNEIQFLYFIANKVGIPQYYDMLNDNFNQKSFQINDVNLFTLGAMINDNSLKIKNDKLHKYQYEVLNKFDLTLQNRFLLTAPTSFGKTFLIYQIVEKMGYNNIVLMFPTISLLSENFEKLLTIRKVNKFWSNYKIHTLSDDEEVFEKNIWVITPERFLSIKDKGNLVKYDFIFIDEIYKIDNEYLIDNETSAENERDTAYRLALEYSCRSSKDILLAGPYMEVQNTKNLEVNSLQNFVKDRNFEILNYNKIEIVNKKILVVKKRKKYNIDNINIIINQTSIYSVVASIINTITTEKDNTIVYYSTKAGVEKYAKEIIPFLNILPFNNNEDLTLYNNFIEHLEKNFGTNWVIVKSLRNRIGVHHGLVPKYVQKQIIEFFNIGILTVLISTTTITEGVNTSAKNIIVKSDKKGIKALRHFDAMNIAGRAGRFYHHYLGRVIVVRNDFNDRYEENEDILKHKNYDKNTSKNEIDYLITDDKYLSQKHIEARKAMYKEVDKRDIHYDIIEQFKIIEISEKLEIYDTIINFTKGDFLKMKELIQYLNFKENIKKEGFQLILKTIYPIVKNKKLSFLIEQHCKENNSFYSVLTFMVYNYLKTGFSGVFEYNLKKYDIDEAMRKSAELIYSILKYQLVKYLGVFDLMYRCVQMKKSKEDFEDIPGLSKLIKKLEYGVLTKKGRILNDYGVPFNILGYYEKGNLDAKKNFDKYEIFIDNKISELLK